MVLESVSELENFNQISNSENDSLEFVCLQLKILFQVIIKNKYLFGALRESI